MINNGEGKRYIRDKQYRNSTYCKRRRGLLKNSIEISEACDKQVFMVIYDPEKDRAVQYVSTPGFSFEEAYKNVKRLQTQGNHMDIYGDEDLKNLDESDYDASLN